MARRTAAAAGAAAAALAFAGAARAADAPKCQIGLLADIKVEFRGLQPVMPGSVNGQRINILADTGATSSLMARGSAVRLHLPLTDMPNVHMYGAGGNTTAYRTNLGELKIAQFTTRNLILLVAGERALGGVDLLLGEDFWTQADEEFDLKNGAIRMMKVTGCEDEQLPYWSKGPYNVVPLASDGGTRLPIVNVKVNGRNLRAVLDSGAQTSVIDRAAAQTMGLALDDAAGTSTGLGRDVSENQLAHLDSFVIGDEAINNTRLRVSDLFSRVGFNETGSHIAQRPVDIPSMLLGADFLRSHRVFLARSRHKVFFTYEGGPVFDLRKPPAEESARDPGASGG